MPTTVIICSHGRPDVLHETVLDLLEQTRLPDEILLAVADPASVLPRTAALPRVRVVLAPAGASAQRNAGIEALLAPSSFVAFLDDDLALLPDYLESMEQFMDDLPDVVLANGNVHVNGAGRAPIPRAQADLAIRAYRPRPEPEYARSGYGCNLFVRRSVLATVRFEEALPAYSMMEDEDFSAQCRPLGRIAYNFRTAVGHLAASGGRSNGLRIGYSEIANSFFLWKKGTVSGRYCFVSCWLRSPLNSAANWLTGRRGNRAYYRQVFFGNLRAFLDLPRGRLHPGRILSLPG